VCRVCVQYPEDGEDEERARWHFEKFGEILPSRRVYDDGKDITDTHTPDQWPWPFMPDGRRSSRSRR